MDANTHPGPPATRRNMTTRSRLRSARVVLCASVVVLLVPALVLLIRSNGIMDLAALRQQHIAGCLISLGLLCLGFSLYLVPHSYMTPRWLRQAGVALAVLMLALVLYGLALYAFAFPSAEGLASTLMLIASLGTMVAMMPAILGFGTRLTR